MDNSHVSWFPGPRELSTCWWAAARALEHLSSAGTCERGTYLSAPKWAEPSLTTGSFHTGSVLWTPWPAIWRMVKMLMTFSSRSISGLSLWKFPAQNCVKNWLARFSWYWSLDQRYQASKKWLSLFFLTTSFPLHTIGALQGLAWYRTWAESWAWTWTQTWQQGLLQAAAGFFRRLKQRLLLLKRTRDRLKQRLLLLKHTRDRFLSDIAMTHGASYTFLCVCYEHWSFPCGNILDIALHGGLPLIGCIAISIFSAHNASQVMTRQSTDQTKVTVCNARENALQSKLRSIYTLRQCFFLLAKGTQYQFWLPFCVKWATMVFWPRWWNSLQTCNFPMLLSYIYTSRLCSCLLITRSYTWQHTST